MSVSSIFKKYPKEIHKDPVIDENNPIYKDYVVPCLKGLSQGASPVPSVIREICHIPKEKMSKNDLMIFLSACEKVGFCGIDNCDQFKRDLIFASLKEGNQSLFLNLLNLQKMERASGSSGFLRQSDLNELLGLASSQEEGEDIMQRLIQAGASANAQDASGKTILLKVFEDRGADREEKMNKSCVLIESGASIAGINRKDLLDFLDFAVLHDEVRMKAIRKVSSQDKSLISEKNGKGKTLLENLSFMVNLVPSYFELSILYGDMIEKADIIKIDLSKDLHFAFKNSAFHLALAILKRDSANQFLKDPKLAASLYLPLACFGGIYELVELLLKKGIDPNYLNVGKSTAVQNALNGKSQDKQSLALLLQKYKGDFHLKDMEGMSGALLIRAKGLDIAPEHFPLTRDEEEFLRNKVAGHVASIRNCPQFPFEGFYDQLLAAEMVESLRYFFLDPAEEQDLAVQNALIETFSLASREVSPRIQSERIGQGKPTIVSSGWHKHRVKMVFVKDPESAKEEDGLLCICNRGDMIDSPLNVLKIVRIDLRKVTPTIVDNIQDSITMFDASKGYQFLYNQVPINLAREDGLPQSDFCLALQSELALSLQNSNTCAYSSHKAALRFLWAALLYQGKDTESLNIARQAKIKTKRWAFCAHLLSLDKFTADLDAKNKPKFSLAEMHYLTGAYEKIKKRLKKMPAYKRAIQKSMELIKRNKALTFMALKDMINASKNALPAIAAPASSLKVVEIS